MLRAVSSVFFIVLFLILMIYVFAIIFTAQIGLAMCRFFSVIEWCSISLHFISFYIQHIQNCSLKEFHTIQNTPLGAASAAPQEIIYIHCLFVYLWMYIFICIYIYIYIYIYIFDLFFWGVGAYSKNLSVISASTFKEGCRTPVEMVNTVRLDKEYRMHLLHNLQRPPTHIRSSILGLSPAKLPQWYTSPPLAQSESTKIKRTNPEKLKLRKRKRTQHLGKVQVEKTETV